MICWLLPHAYHTGFIMKILPITSPIVRYSPSVDNFLSVLCLHKEKTLPWIIENYIEIIFNPTQIAYFMMEFLDIYKFWWNCPFVSVSRIDRVLVGDNVIGLIKNAIDRNAYVMFCVDTYYVHAYSSYRKSHFPHEIFIYGYDEDELYTLDYFDFWQCDKRKISATEIEKAFFELDNKTDYLRGIISFRVRPNIVERGRNCTQFSEEGVYIPDRKLIKHKVQGFLESSPYVLASYPNEYDPCFGFYSGIEAFYKMVGEISVENFARVRKPLCLLYDHIHIMRIRVQYLSDYFELKLDELVRECQEIEKGCLLLRNKYLRSLMANRLSDADIIKSEVDGLLGRYRELLVKIISVL